jgi:hypothetical protein
MSNAWARRKGKYRPFFDEKMRITELSVFLQKFKDII